MNTSFPPPGAAEQVLPLTGVTVVAVEQAVAAPLATRHMADLGARVLKIERPDGGDFARDYDETVRGMSSHFIWLNRGKESVALDLKSAKDIRAIHSLLEDADVFIQNLAPGAIERLGLGIDEMRIRYPRLICASISGYGSQGPFRDAKAYDLLIQSEAGLVSITGTEEEPAKTGIPTADIAAGMYTFSGILAALYERERTGIGSAIEVSLFDSLIEWMGYPLYYTAHGGAAPARTGTSHAAIAPYGTIRASDGSEIIVAVQNEREWHAFCEHVLLRPELADEARFSSQARRVENRSALDHSIAAVTTRLSSAELGKRLVAGRIAHARRRELVDVLDHPQLIARGRWVEVDTPVGPVPAILPPIVQVGRSMRMGRVPSLGEHTAAVLSSVELDDRPQS